MLKEKFKKIEQKLLNEIVSFYKDRLISVVIFGSTARGTQRFDSDIDILIIAKRLPHSRMKRIKEFEYVEKKIEPLLESLRQEGINTYISAVIKSQNEAELGSPLFLDMVEDAKILFDRDGFFLSVIMRLSNRLKELGAKRIWRGNTWYWDLKPDYKHGDTIKL